METSKETDEVVDVLVLGLGLAGLGAGIAMSSLNKNGENISYLILEAQNRAGGRVRTEELLNFNTRNQKYTKKSVDTGAQWLHSRNNFLYSISEKYELLTSYQSKEGLGSFFYENCEQIDPFLVKKVELQIGRMLKECENYINTKKYPRSVGHFLRERFQEFVDNLEDPIEQNQAMNLFDWHLRFQIVDNSCGTLDNLSAKYWGKYSFNGEISQAHYNFKYGFQSVVDYLTKLLNNEWIHYNKEVTEIEILEKQKNRRNRVNISVKCSDGSAYLGKSVLITFSLGVLKKKHATLFRPSLPDAIMKSIESIGFGN